MRTASKWKWLRLFDGKQKTNVSMSERCFLFKNTFQVGNFNCCLEDLAFLNCSVRAREKML